VEQLSLKSSSAIRRAQEVNVAMYGFSCRLGNPGQDERDSAMMPNGIPG
jgi:hypothetical protein